MGQARLAFCTVLPNVAIGPTGPTPEAQEQLDKKDWARLEALQRDGVGQGKSTNERPLFLFTICCQQAGTEWPKASAQAPVAAFVAVGLLVPRLLGHAKQHTAKRSELRLCVNPNMHNHTHTHTTPPPPPHTHMFLIGTNPWPLWPLHNKAPSKESTGCPSCVPPAHPSTTLPFGRCVCVRRGSPTNSLEFL